MYYNKRNLKMIADNLQLLTESFDRDKVLRLTQYLARICVWIFSDNNFPAGSIGIWPLLTKQTALVRRLSRLGKNFQYYQNIIQTSLTKDKDHVEFLTTMGHQIGIAAFLSCDALIALDTLGLYKLKNLKRVQMEASRMWSVAIMCNFVSGLHALRKLRLPKRFGENNDIADYQCMSMKRKTYRLRLVSCLCDLIISTSPFRTIGVSDGVIGISGVTSTIINTLISVKTSQLT